MLCERAMQAMVARARPGVPEYELRAAAGAPFSTAAVTSTF